jgi:hypothetical protein
VSRCFVAKLCERAFDSGETVVDKRLRPLHLQGGAGVKDILRRCTPVDISGSRLAAEFFQLAATQYG